MAASGGRGLKGYTAKSTDTYYNVTVYNTTETAQQASSNMLLTIPMFDQIRAGSVRIAVSRYRVPTSLVPLTHNNIPFGKWALAINVNGHTATQIVPEVGQVPDPNPRFIVDEDIPALLQMSQTYSNQLVARTDTTPISMTGSVRFANGTSPNYVVTFDPANEGVGIGVFQMNPIGQISSEPLAILMPPEPWVWAVAINREQQIVAITSATTPIPGQTPVTICYFNYSATDKAWTHVGPDYVSTYTIPESNNCLAFADSAAWFMCGLPSVNTMGVVYNFGGPDPVFTPYTVPVSANYKTLGSLCVYTDSKTGLFYPAITSSYDGFPLSTPSIPQNEMLVLAQLTHLNPGTPAAYGLGNVMRPWPDNQGPPLNPAGWPHSTPSITANSIISTFGGVLAYNIYFENAYPASAGNFIDLADGQVKLALPPMIQFSAAVYPNSNRMRSTGYMAFSNSTVPFVTGTPTFYAPVLFHEQTDFSQALCEYATERYCFVPSAWGYAFSSMPETGYAKARFRTLMRAPNPQIGTQEGAQVWYNGDTSVGFGGNLNGQVLLNLSRNGFADHESYFKADGVFGITSPTGNNLNFFTGPNTVVSLPITNDIFNPAFNSPVIINTQDPSSYNSLYHLIRQNPADLAQYTPITYPRYPLVIGHNVAMYAVPNASTWFAGRNPNCCLMLQQCQNFFSTTQQLDQLGNSPTTAMSDLGSSSMQVVQINTRSHSVYKNVLMAGVTTAAVQHADMTETGVSYYPMFLLAVSDNGAHITSNALNVDSILGTGSSTPPCPNLMVPLYDSADFDGTHLAGSVVLSLVRQVQDPGYLNYAQIFCYQPDGSWDTTPYPNELASFANLTTAVGNYAWREAVAASVQNPITLQIERIVFLVYDDFDTVNPNPNPRQIRIISMDSMCYTLNYFGDVDMSAVPYTDASRHIIGINVIELDDHVEGYCVRLMITFGGAFGHYEYATTIDLSSVAATTGDYYSVSPITAWDTVQAFSSFHTWYSPFLTSYLLSKQPDGGAVNFSDLDPSVSTLATIVPTHDTSGFNFVFNTSDVENHPSGLYVRSLNRFAASTGSDNALFTILDQSTGGTVGGLCTNYGATLYPPPLGNGFNVDMFSLNEGVWTLQSTNSSFSSADFGVTDYMQYFPSSDPDVGDIYFIGDDHQSVYSIVAMREVAPSQPYYKQFTWTKGHFSAMTTGPSSFLPGGKADIFHYQTYCNQVNAAFTSAVTSLGPAVWNPATRMVPTLQFDGVSQKFRIALDGSLSELLGAPQSNNNTSIFFNGPLQSIFGFPTTGAFYQSPFDVFQQLDLYDPINAAKATESLPPPPYYVYQQTASNGILFDLARVFVQSDSFMVNGNQEGTNSSVQCIMDTVPDVDNITRGEALIFDPFFNRWYSVLQSSMMQRMAFAMYYQTRDGNIYPLMVPPGDFWSLLVVFRQD
jgi:hypothetical protein